MLVAETLAAQHGQSWWDTTVPEGIRNNVRDNMQREVDSGVTLRSEDEKFADRDVSVYLGRVQTCVP